MHAVNIRRLGRHQAPETVAQGLCIQAYVGSKLRTPAGQLPCAHPWRVPQKPGWKRHKCFRATWCPSRKHALGGQVSASRYRLRWINIVADLTTPNAHAILDECTHRSKRRKAGRRISNGDQVEARQVGRLHRLIGNGTLSTKIGGEILRGQTKMSLLRPLTILCGVFWLLGAYESAGGDHNLGGALVDIFGTLTVLSLVVQGVIWVRNRHGEKVKLSVISIVEIFRRSALMAAVVFGAALLIWMNAYETLPNGDRHRNRISGLVCDIDASCWFSNE